MDSITEEEYKNAKDLEPKIKKQMFNKKVEIKFETDNNKKKILEEEYKNIKKNYAKILTIIISYERYEVKKDEKYKRR